MLILIMGVQLNCTTIRRSTLIREEDAMAKEGGKIFPEYLNSDSHGLAATMLAGFFAGIEFDPDKEIVPDAEYGPKLTAAVKRLQRRYGLEQDGNFGPQTREAFKEEFGFDPDEVPLHHATRAVFPGNKTVFYPES